MTTPLACKHGQLRRKCEICDLDDQLDEARAEIAALRVDKNEIGETRPVYLIWEINRDEGGQCLRAIDELEERMMAHLRMFRSEAATIGRESKFFSEKSQLNHAFGHNDMKAARIIIDAAREGK